MLESINSNKVRNIEGSFVNNCDVKFNIRTWLETENLKSICSNSNRLYRKRYYPSTFDKEFHSNQNSEVIGKRRKEYNYKQNEFTWNKNKKNRKPKTDFYRKPREVFRMTRTGCCQLRRQDSRYINNRMDRNEADYQRNRSLSSPNERICLSHNQLPIIDDLSDHRINSSSDRRNPRLIHQISTHSSHPTIHGKEASNLSNNINNCCNIQGSYLSQSSQPCGFINHLPLMAGNSPYGLPPQVNGCIQPTRRRLNTTDLAFRNQGGISRSSEQYQSHPIDSNSSQPPISSCPIPNRTSSSNTSSFPLITRSYCQNPNQFRFATYPISSYPPPQHAIFTRTSIPTTTIFPHNPAFCSTVHMPTVTGDVVSSAPCQQCTIVAGSRLNTFSNVSSALQFSVAPTAANLIALTPVPRDRIHGSPLTYLPVHPMSNLYHRHPYLPAAWSYNDLTSILHNSATRHLLQDNLAQRLLSPSPNIGIQFLMISPSSVLGPNDPSQPRHHLIPISRTDTMSPIAMSRYLPLIDHFPLMDQPKPGITKQELDQIPIKKFCKSDSDGTLTEDDKDRCMICLEDFVPNEVIRMLRCAHDFHSSCVEKWLKINRTCPLCRADAVGQYKRRS